ncbi:MAG: succinate dehydrogenase iron-sulfur subunit [Desulfobacteraceae bacterium]|nr:succinate dehydrogenase iron-sulfur subunit [Desulfobacteraceae bacterium]
MKMTLKIQRFNPENDAQPFFQEYTLDADPNERLLDALMYVKRFQDGSLGFRKSCAHGVCGSDAIRINGKNGLACKTLIKEVIQKDGDSVTLQPLRYLSVQRDLIVDQTEFFTKYRSVKPFLINDEEVAEKERIQSPEERLRFDDTTNCILCAACYSACPVLESDPLFIGPAAIAQAFRFLADSRDRGFAERLPVLDRPEGVWDCENHFECTKCCPRSILITKRINQTKKMIEKHKDSEADDRQKP